MQPHWQPGSHWQHFWQSSGSQEHWFSALSGAPHWHLLSSMMVCYYGLFFITLPLSPPSKGEGGLFLYFNNTAREVSGSNIITADLRGFWAD
ncbi:MAG: hypothetical protein A3B04_02630 [Candidatus Portnoybacteria bacterium RIFCSPLOWO2_02_FULL_39_11]|uniref:Uncharacterized protein n=1 Tax=Candidatus Portnoybacteria bacterium RIFCSPLOWO2_02_FULL_39_11 TaxID=1802001 RepID=A0A1G2FWR5_9BACT|nr:MAG: hypothetical protein A3B04_02630 [Candidatus Portnoybacteria bacterium RIFCSPLOWO2_02_FULL_39_11]